MASPGYASGLVEPDVDELSQLSAPVDRRS